MSTARITRSESNAFRRTPRPGEAEHAELAQEVARPAEEPLTTKSKVRRERAKAQTPSEADFHSVVDVLSHSYAAHHDNQRIEATSTGGEAPVTRARNKRRSSSLLRGGDDNRRTDGERDRFFELALDLLAIGTFDGFFTRVNSSWVSTLGWSPEELVAKEWLTFVHPHDLQATIEAGQRLRMGIDVVAFENRYRCKNGDYRWLQWKVKPDNEKGLLYCVARDITEARADKALLQDVSESLRTTLESIGDAVIATDVKGNVMRMNPVAEKLTGWTAVEARDRPLPEVLRLITEDGRTPVQSPIISSLSNGIVASISSGCLVVRKDGSELAIADSCAPILTSEGVVNGAVIVFRDMTPARHAAASEASYQQQLVLSNRMASVGTLAAGVAHEINNPLTYVTANIDSVLEELRIIAGGSISGRMRDLEKGLLEAREGAARVKKIVRGLKTFSRDDEEHREVIDVIPVLEQSVSMALNEIRHRATLVKEFGKTPLVDADEGRLGQVFINLLVNAAQALPELATVANEIKVSTSTDEKGRAVVEIADTGPGIPAELLARIFDPFFTTKPVGVGTGLGLAICHNIVTAMAGEITVKSVIGCGTTFRIVLPASTRALPEVIPSVTTARELSALPVGRVLVVDDEPAVGIAVQRVLRHHNVTVVTKGQEALKLLATGEHFDVVLTDLMMPGMSGMELYATVARLYPKVALRFVFVTGGAFTLESSAFLEKVTNERIEKPFEFQHLRDMVQKFVR